MKVATRPAMSKLALMIAAAGTLGTIAPRAVQAEVQPHMHQALAILKNARRELLKGSSDKGGFRVKALANVNSAIANVQRGIDYDNRHQPKKNMRRKIKM